MRQTFCIRSVSSSSDISSSPLNRSLSKNLWTFAKDSRFKQSSPYCDRIYDLQLPLSSRKGAGIGYATKTDFTKDLTCSPSASKYNIKSLFDNNLTYRKGFTLPLSRDKIPSQGYIALDPLKVPSPAAYQNLKMNKGIRFTMGTKGKDMRSAVGANSPGVGKYQNPEAMSALGNYFVAKHRRTGSILIKNKPDRFIQPKNQSPGPGRYQEINKLSDKGYYPCSRNYGSGKRYFDKEKRLIKLQDAENNSTPGPGSYRLPSDFGHYDYPNAQKRNTSNGQILKH